MERHEREMPWVKRVEELIKALDGSTIGELELREGDTEILIRRRPDMLLVASSGVQQIGTPLRQIPGGAELSTVREDRSQPVASPLTGVYYSSPSPTQPSFVNLGDIIHVGQIVALVEAMKVFNEIASEVAGRVVAMVATNGDVVQKGEALLKIEPL